MRLRLLILLCVALTCFASRGRAADQVVVPPLVAHVTDQVHLLSEDRHAALDTTLAAYETAHGTQIAVLLISKTEPEAMAQYSLRVFDAWKLGRPHLNDGLLILLAKDNAKPYGRLRIEVGRGLEGAVTDVQVKRVIDEVIAPKFKVGDFAGGLDAAVDKLTGMIDTDRLPAPAAITGWSDETVFWLCVIVAMILVVLAVCWFLATSARATSRRTSTGVSGSRRIGCPVLSKLSLRSHAKEKT